MERRTFPKKDFERLAVVKKNISSLVSWRKGERVFAEAEDDGKWAIRPEDRLGPTLINVPGSFLKFVDPQPEE